MLLIAQSGFLFVSSSQLIDLIAIPCPQTLNFYTTLPGSKLRFRANVQLGKLNFKQLVVYNSVLFAWFWFLSGMVRVKAQCLSYKSTLFSIPQSPFILFTGVCVAHNVFGIISLFYMLINVSNQVSLLGAN